SSGVFLCPLCPVSPRLGEAQAWIGEHYEQCEHQRSIAMARQHTTDNGGLFTTTVFDRSPKLTVLCRSLGRVWFLLHRGQFHRRPPTAARAGLSTGVLTRRRPAGELAHMDGGGEVPVQNVAAAVAAAWSVSKREVRIVPATG